MITERFSREAMVSIFFFVGVTCITASAAWSDDLPGTVVENTTPALAGILRWVAPNIASHCLLPDGAEPHHFHPGARQLERIAGAGLLVRSSADDSNWFDGDLIDSGRILDLWPASEKRKNHAWLDIDQVSMVLPRVAERLIEAGVLTRDQWQARQLILQQDAARVEAGWQALLPALQQRGVIMQHPSWQALFDRLGVPVYAVLESAGGGHHHGFRASALEQALAAITAHPQALLIADPRHDDKGLKWLRQQHPASRLVYLSSMGACQQPWPEFMQENLNVLSQILSAH